MPLPWNWTHAMAPEELSAKRQLTGDDLIAEILRNCEAGLFTMRRTVLVPSVFHVYLHPGDYDAIRSVLPALVSEAKLALAERLDNWNRAAQPSRIAKYLGVGPDTGVQYKILDPEWSIEFHPDLEEKLTAGEIEIYSELASAPKPDFDGARTTHVTKRSADGSPAAPDETATLRLATAAAPAGVPLATLRYRDDEGPHEVPMTKDQIVIGRGGKSYWVDVRLQAPVDVSREHCRIRRDPSNNRFYIRDVSQFGTSIDGKRIPRSVGGDSEPEQVLPSRCSIELAGVLTIEFEAAAT